MGKGMKICTIHGMLTAKARGGGTTAKNPFLVLRYHGGIFAFCDTGIQEARILKVLRSRWRAEHAISLRNQSRGWLGLGCHTGVDGVKFDGGWAADTSVHSMSCT